MEALKAVIYFETWIILLSLTAIAIYQLLTGKINTKGMLLDKNTMDLSPERVQLLVITLFSALFYIFHAFVNRDSGQLPEIPNELILLLGGSNLIYLGAKSDVKMFKK